MAGGNFHSREQRRVVKRTARDDSVEVVHQVGAQVLFLRHGILERGQLRVPRENGLPAGFGKARVKKQREGRVRIGQVRGQGVDLFDIVGGKRRQRLVLEMAGPEENGDADDDENGDAAGGGDKAGDDGVGGAPEFLGRSFFVLLLENGDECGRERALAEQAAEEVGNLEGEREGAGDHPRAHEPGVNDFAQHPHDAAGHGGGGHRAGGFQHLRHRARSLGRRVQGSRGFESRANSFNRPGEVGTF